MPSALGYGLMGAAMGGLKGAHDLWQQEQVAAQTQRLEAARRLEAQQLAEIEAKFANAKDEKDHEQAKELEGIKAGGREKLEAEKIAAADKRAAEANASREKAAAIRASRPRGSGTPPAKKLFEDKSSGKQVWLGEDEEIPEGYFRVSARSAPPKSEPAKPASAAAKPDPNAPPVPGAKKAPDGLWYVQQDNKWFKVEP
jgi:hypothetical protein